MFKKKNPYIIIKLIMHSKKKLWYSPDAGDEVEGMAPHAGRSTPPAARREPRDGGDGGLNNISLCPRILNNH